MALANYPASHEDCDGHSVAFHPCAFDGREGGRDTRVVRAGQDDGVVTASFDLDECATWRRTEMWGGARRRPRQLPGACRRRDAVEGRRLNRLYVVAAWVPRRETIDVGALGPVTFARGWHAYVGSARRGRDARVARHRRAAKPLALAGRLPLRPAPRDQSVAVRHAAVGMRAGGAAVGGPVEREGRARRLGLRRPGHLLYAARLGSAASGRPRSGTARDRQASHAASGTRPATVSRATPARERRPLSDERRPAAGIPA